MTTARKRAREAAIKASEMLDDEATIPSADAASDVWEPLVRELRDCLSDLYVRYDTQAEAMKTINLWSRANEALGEGP